MEKRSRRRTRDLVTQTASQGLSENEIGCARISMMARSTNAPFKGRIQMRKTNPLHLFTFGLQRTAGPYRWSGRIEARIGLRMMPTFPRSPLSFRTASFPQYGWKADCPSGAFLGDRRLKPAPGIRRPPSSLHPPFVHFVVATVVRSESGLRTRSCTAMRWNTPPTPGALARVRVVVSRSVIT